MLNGHAYMCALTGMDLQSGSQDIDEALLLVGQSPELLDTRAYVRFKLGQSDAALEDMRMAIRIEEGRQYSVQYDEQEQRLLHRRNLAVMYHHRGEIYEKFADDEKNKDRADFKQKAEIDFHRADQLGFDPKNGVF